MSRKSPIKEVRVQIESMRVMVIESNHWASTRVEKVLYTILTDQ